jgi:hypothetical protein
MMGSGFKVGFARVFLLPLLLNVTACSEGSDGGDGTQGGNEPAHEEQGFSLSGVVLQDGAPAGGAKVQIDDVGDLAATSDPSGHFEIGNVGEGEHHLSVTLGDSEHANVERHYDVSVSEDLVLDPITLPTPVILEHAEAVEEGGITISWAATDAEDFREYKLYRLDGAGLDESTGELVYVSTEIDATSFVDTDVLPGLEYYYRVFVMNDTGRLGGSNIVSQEALNPNLVVNGDFEELDAAGFAAGWARYGNPVAAITSSTQAMSGEASIRLDTPTSYEYWVQQTISSEAAIEAGDTLIITGNYRVDRLATDSAIEVVVGDDYLALRCPPRRTPGPPSRSEPRCPTGLRSASCSP